MHWFWRATISVVAAFVGTLLFHAVAFRVMGRWLFPLIAQLGWIYWLSFTIPAAIIAIASYAALTRRYAQAMLAESRCRKCGYDLTGNVSGTCPECGVAAADLRQEPLRGHEGVSVSSNPFSGPTHGEES